MMLSRLFKDTASLVARSKAGTSLLTSRDLRLVLSASVLVSASFAMLASTGKSDLAQWVGVVGLIGVNAYAAVRSVQRSAVVHEARQAECAADSPRTGQ